MLHLATLTTELTIVGLVAIVLFVAALLAMAPLKRFQLPFTVALMLAGFAAGGGINYLEHHYPDGHGGLWDVVHMLGEGSHLTPQMILFVFLPPLVFESAFALDGRALIKNLVPIVVLAVPVLIFSTVMTGAVVIKLGGESYGLNWPAALLFGALISATDPVAVVALFKQLGAPKRLGVLVEGESLCNDGTAIVLFNILLAMVVATLAPGAEAEALPFGERIADGVKSFAVVAAGGLLVGVLLARGIFALIGKDVANTSVQVTLCLVLAYAAFIIAEHFLHVSGVMATVAAGLVASSYGKTKVDPTVEHFMHSFWEYVAFVMNALIFFLVGLVITRQVDLHHVDHLLPLLVGTIAVVVVVRAVGVFASVRFLNWFSKDRISLPYQTVMWWGGLRGAVSLALALTVFTYVGVPQENGVALSLPESTRTTVLVLTSGVVLFTLLVNAMTMPPVIRKLGLDAPTLSDRFAVAHGEAEQVEVMEREIERLAAEGAFHPSALDELRQDLHARREAAETELKALRQVMDEDPRIALPVAARLALSIEKRETMNRFSKGQLPEGATKRLLASADRLVDRIKSGRGFPPDRCLSSSNSFGSRLVRGLETLPLVGRVARRRRARQLGEEIEVTRALYLATRSVADALAEVEHSRAIPPAALSTVQKAYAQWNASAHEQLEILNEQFPEYAGSSQALMASLQVLRAERHRIHHMAEEGILTCRAASDAEGALVEREKELRNRHATHLDLEAKSMLSSALEDLEEASPEVVDLMASWLTSRTCLKGETLTEDVEACDYVFVITRGWVEVLDADSPEGAPLTRLGPGSRTESLAVHGRQRVTLRAMTPVNVLEMRNTG